MRRSFCLQPLTLLRPTRQSLRNSASLRLSVTSQLWRWNLSGSQLSWWWGRYVGKVVQEGRKPMGPSWMRRPENFCDYNCERRLRTTSRVRVKPVDVCEGLVKRLRACHRQHDNHCFQPLLSGWCSRLCGLQPPSCLCIWGERCVSILKAEDRATELLESPTSSTCTRTY